MATVSKTIKQITMSKSDRSFACNAIYITLSYRISIYTIPTLYLSKCRPAVTAVMYNRQTYIYIKFYFIINYKLHESTVVLKPTIVSYIIVRLRLPGGVYCSSLPACTYVCVCCVVTHTFTNHQVCVSL